MYIRFLCALIFVVSSINATSAEARLSLGFGVQYAGLIGLQGALPAGNGNVRWGIGVMGASAGYDYFLSENTSIGAQGFYTIYGEGGGLNLNYHFPSISSSGWMIGWDVYAAKSELSSESRRNNYNGFTFISFGYKF